MRVSFGSLIAESEKAEIDEVLQRIAIGDGPGRWRERPEEIRILRRLAGGRSGADVFEATVHRGEQRSQKVVKVGAFDTLHDEFGAYLKYLKDASRFFVPLEAVTAELLTAQGQTATRRQAVVYDHVSHFSVGTSTQTHTLEAVASKAVASGAGFAQTLTMLKKLLGGITNDLYEKCMVGRTALHETWNTRLGEDALIEVDRATRSKQLLYKKAAGSATTIALPRDLERASLRVDESLIGRVVELPDCRMSWRDGRLIAQVDTHNVQVEIRGTEGTDIRVLAKSVRDGEFWTVRGHVVAVRTSERRKLIDRVPELSFGPGTLIGPGARAEDPFISLEATLDEVHELCLTSLTHGDLNPRNILVVEGEPCLIDYAQTGLDLMLTDFVRLEGTLVRDVLGKITWRQHVRLQRALWLATMLGDEHAAFFSSHLRNESERLGRAFDLCWTIRTASRNAYPHGRGQEWAAAYLTQLFLFAHLTLKWSDQSSAELVASFAMAAVAAEARVPRRAFQNWTNEQLQTDAAPTMERITVGMIHALPVLAGFAEAIQTINKQSDGALRAALASARTKLVCDSFLSRALERIVDLEKDYQSYVSLLGRIESESPSVPPPMPKSSSASSPVPNEKLVRQMRPAATEKVPAEPKDVLAILEEHDALVLLGGAGAGKSTVARIWEYLLARSIRGRAGDGDAHEERGRIAPRMPLAQRAKTVADRLTAAEADTRRAVRAVFDEAPEWFAIGGVHVIIDALNELSDEERQVVATFVVEMRKLFPATPVLLCHRSYGYVPGLVPFPTVTLLKMSRDQALQYVRDYLRARSVEEAESVAATLIRLAFESSDYENIRDLVETPLFLWMLVERYRETKTLPRTRSALFETFSQWYLEERHHGAQSVLRFGYKEKLLLLGRLGSELLKRGEAEMSESEVEELADSLLHKHGAGTLGEIVRAEMLVSEHHRLRFRHQSFQDYFAARHFLEYEANEVTAPEHVAEIRWHDMYTILVAFGGDHPQIVRKVLEEALKVDALLAAQCLRMAESPDPRLVMNFIEHQRSVLRDAEAGDVLHEQAATLLGELGSADAIATLFSTVGCATAPERSRRECLSTLWQIADRPEFATVREKHLSLLADCIEGLLEEPAPTSIRAFAVVLVAMLRLRSLDSYLCKLVRGGEWELRLRARLICDVIGLRLTLSEKRAFKAAAKRRLGSLDSELGVAYEEARFSYLIEERNMIFRHLGSRDDVALLLSYRFRFGAGHAVGPLLDELVSEWSTEDNGATPGMATIRALLRDAVTKRQVAAWIASVRDGSVCEAFASGHRLCSLGRDLTVGHLRRLLDHRLSPPRLRIAAALIESAGHASVAPLLEDLMRKFVENVRDSDSIEALSCLGHALDMLDKRRSRRFLAWVSMVLGERWKNRLENGQAYWYHVQRNCEVLDDQDANTMLSGDERDVRAAIVELGSRVFASGTGDDATIYKLERSAIDRFLSYATAETRPYWLTCLANAATLIPNPNGAVIQWLMRAAELSNQEIDVVVNWRYGAIQQRCDVPIIRAIGLVARRDVAELPDEAVNALRFLRRKYEQPPSHDGLHFNPSLPIRTYRGAVAGALACCGDWEPLLAELGSGEPWLHELARACLADLRGPFIVNQALEADRAARWITNRLRCEPKLPREVRSTLTFIKANLEERLGRRLTAS